METDIARTFAALNATNEAILYAKSPEELYGKVCEAAFSSGDFLATAVFVLEPQTGLLKVASGFGDDLARLRSIDISIIANTPEGSGVCGQAFRDQKVCVSNDFLNNSHSVAWREGARASHVGAAMGLPLICNGRSVGVFLVTRREAGSLDEQTVSLFERIAANISFALENFERAGEKARADAQKERLSRMFAALSATNEAIMRARSRTELFELVSEAAVVGGNFTSTAIVLERPGAEYLECVASAGPDRERAFNVKLSADPAKPEGQGITGTAFRTRVPCISNDYLGDFGTSAHFYEEVRDSGTRSGAALPLLKDGKPIGAIVFLSSEIGAFSPELIALLQRLAENVSFALDNFDRADEKARADEQKERLARMFAALSATNEAIMRAGSRVELFELVCVAAASGGKFTSTTIALANPGSDFLTIVAAAGPSAETTRHVRLSISDTFPEGRGLSGTAFRTQQPCLSNDYPTDPRVTAFHAIVQGDGARSGAAFPLIIRGQAVGVMIYMSTEPDTFTPEFAGLLQRLADNVSFALENFERADEKTKADERIEYLASHDSLTKLPNRDMFNELLRHAIEGASRHQRSLALLFIDLDRFKVINDSLGHDAGDMLLLEVANRLRGSCARATSWRDSAATNSSSSWRRSPNATTWSAIAAGLLSALGRPMQLSGHECHATASIGIAMYPSDGSGRAGR